MRWDSPPAMTIDTSKDYRAVIELEKGDEIVIDLFEDGAPTTVNNFVFLAREGFYDGVTFHRVLEGFMAQTGDPTGTGGGGPGYRFDNEVSPDLRHEGPGILSMANAGMRNGQGTNGSQFFITFRETHFLDGYNLDGTEKDCAAESCHSVFGKVVEGMDVVNNISLRDPGSATTPGDAIKTIRIEEN
ncbi:MAG: peptidylprolyl isomerase [Chloroflexi bacterium]|nr:peptidylprolyl isomerase [Chloroflexota bacterium]